MKTRLTKKVRSPEQPPKLNKASRVVSMPKAAATWWRKELSSAFNDDKPATTQMGAGASEQPPEFRSTKKDPQQKPHRPDLGRRRGVSSS
jgi:hypothetical protein